ncbi:MAG: hypothetical protein EOO90_28300 [Pedobacter sp.]|nr:MAG: hypothetical protein EOO90_28300 [Pedobacter sp.]
MTILHSPELVRTAVGTSIRNDIVDYIICMNISQLNCMNVYRVYDYRCDLVIRDFMLKYIVQQLMKKSLIRRSVIFLGRGVRISEDKTASHANELRGSLFALLLVIAPQSGSLCSLIEVQLLHLYI